MTSRQELYKLLLAAAVAALLVGLYARFVGLGVWPFGVDEFYISRSIDNILRTGLPHFPCGGLYTRGLVYQYLVAPIRLTRSFTRAFGSIGECRIESRWIARRVPHRPAPERSGIRPCGPHRAVVVSMGDRDGTICSDVCRVPGIFLWYLVYFLRYTVDRDRAALAPMVGLSVLGTLTWEGGALLAVANLVPVLFRQQRGRLRYSDWAYVAGMLLLYVGLLLATSDFRGAAPDVGRDRAPAQPGMLKLTSGGWWLISHTRRGWRSCCSSLWGVLCRRRLGSGRCGPAWLAAVALCLALLGAISHQFVLCVACLAMVSLSGLVEPQEWRGRGARRFLLCLAVLAGFWLAFGLVTGAWRDCGRRRRQGRIGGLDSPSIWGAFRESSAKFYGPGGGPCRF